MQKNDPADEKRRAMEEHLFKISVESWHEKFKGIIKIFLAPVTFLALMMSFVYNQPHFVIGMIFFSILAAIGFYAGHYVGYKTNNWYGWVFGVVLFNVLAFCVVGMMTST